MSAAYVAQVGFRCRLEWEGSGAERAARRGDIVVVVDVLSFSSVVATAIDRGGEVIPCDPNEDPVARAQQLGIKDVAVSRNDVPEKGRYSLSPVTFLDMNAGTGVVVASPNGAVCSRCARQAEHLLVGSLLNATAVASRVSDILETTLRSVTVVACGERWHGDDISTDGTLRPAIEDYIGAGAILSAIPFDRSPEAELCARSFRTVVDDMGDLIRNSVSGRELYARGYGADVEHVLQRDLYSSVPVMREDGRILGWTPDGMN